mgnify:CR=1 FL=1
MSTIVTRSGKGVPLTATDHDNNVNNLNTDKVETLADLSITSTATEINLLDGVTATTAELNYVDGVTSNIQTQLGTKLPLAGGTMTGTIAGFTSTGIDDNATSTAITIGADEGVLLTEGLSINQNKGLSLDGLGGNTYLYGAADAINVVTAGSLALTVDAAQNTTLATGNLVIGTSGKGIDFSADGNAGGMTSEVLDDYEEGTWTASLTGNGSAPSTAATATGTYTKIGRQVTVHVYLANKNTSGASGEMQVTGLPFNPSQSTTGDYASYGLEAQGSFCVAYARTSGTVEFLEMNDGAAWGAVQIVAGSSKYLDLAMTYET